MFCIEEEELEQSASLSLFVGEGSAQEERREEIGGLSSSRAPKDAISPHIGCFLSLGSPARCRLCSLSLSLSQRR
uniref:Uncharacterized protein n=1 Tax=Caenorhabditis tropicalis TaxID=1561998 RepID=A0A1I7UC11_9PELO